MTLILCIDTSLEQASIVLSGDGQVIAGKTNKRQVDHASWIHTAIHQLLAENNHSLRDLQAIAVVAGPGSYTGLRVGMSTAKGLCFALDLPLITLDTLELMASAQKETKWQTDDLPTLICPMIDARRMEVFAAIYDPDGNIVEPPAAIVLDEHSYEKYLSSHKLIFAGNGTEKWRKICPHNNAVYSDLNVEMVHIARMAQREFTNNRFADLAFAEPSYVKNAYVAPPSPRA
ncbi:MAG TPA: tRNA (adenosine(37)-N6)-threonylcarbamoyltransferase complex dimerization subunit type 1 TsaB [Flavitalea sp.]|nr:tRNA (adenosine(37)-N6)-threonylcarbamoyltransferase complex dimerization subunit type 1 TsaB [Flavitalea sp.]